MVDVGGGLVDVGTTWRMEAVAWLIWLMA